VAVLIAVGVAAWMDVGPTAETPPENPDTPSTELHIRFQCNEWEKTNFCDSSIRHVCVCVCVCVCVPARVCVCVCVLLIAYCNAESMGAHAAICP